MIRGIPLEHLRSSYTGVPAFIIGNGVGRHHLDLTEIYGRGLLIGCNRFLEEIQTDKFPIWCGIQDPAMWMLYKSRFGNHPAPIVVPTEKPENTESEPDRTIELRSENWKTTGHAMLDAVIQLGCSPIIFLGVGSFTMQIGKDRSDHLYEHTKGRHMNKPGLRTYGYIREVGEPAAVGQSHKKIWLKIAKGHPVFNCADGTPCLFEDGSIPDIAWSKLLELPKKYYRKTTVIHGIRTQAGIEEQLN